MKIKRKKFHNRPRERTSPGRRNHHNRYLTRKAILEKNTLIRNQKPVQKRRNSQRSQPTKEIQLEDGKTVTCQSIGGTHSWGNRRKVIKKSHNRDVRVAQYLGGGNLLSRHSRIDPRSGCVGGHKKTARWCEKEKNTRKSVFPIS